MKTRRTFLASLAALSVAPFAKLLPKRHGYLLLGLDPAYRPDQSDYILAKCVNPNGPGPLRFEWVSPVYEAKDGIRNMIFSEKKFIGKWDFKQG